MEFIFLEYSPHYTDRISDYINSACVELLLNEYEDKNKKLSNNLFW